MPNLSKFAFFVRFNYRIGRWFTELVTFCFRISCNYIHELVKVVRRFYKKSSKFSPVKWNSLFKTCQLSLNSCKLVLENEKSTPANASLGIFVSCFFTRSFNLAVVKKLCNTELRDGNKVQHIRKRIRHRIVNFSMEAWLVWGFPR